MSTLTFTKVSTKVTKEEAMEGKGCIYCLHSDCVAFTHGESVCG